MRNYEVQPFAELVAGKSYVGRGIVAGKSADARYAVAAYFIMGRSTNSRNRVFTVNNGAVYTEPYDAAKVEDPSLIIYAALRMYGANLIVTNGDQTDTVCEGLAAGKSFADALSSRCFEPDSPNFTPRISAMLTFANGDFDYQMSILKSEDEKGTACARYTFAYTPLAGLGHFIHTYVDNADPLPTFLGEPERVAIPNDIDTFTDSIWNSLDEQNKISLYVRYTDLETGAYTDRLVNKYV